MTADSVMPRDNTVYPADAAGGLYLGMVATGAAKVDVHGYGSSLVVSVVSVGGVIRSGIV